MSRDAASIHPDDLHEFIRETLADDTLYIMGDEYGAAGLCPYVTFYVRHRPDQQWLVAERMLAVAREFATLADLPFRAIRDEADGHWWHSRDGTLPEGLEARARDFCNRGERVLLEATDRFTPADSARWAIALQVGTDPLRYAFLKLTFRQRWHTTHAASWQDFVIRAITRLQPEHCYSGFEIGNGGFEQAAPPWQGILEQMCGKRLLGMDIDHPVRMAVHSRNRAGWLHPVGLGAGLRTPSWCFLVAPQWLERLDDDGAALRALLAQPDVSHTRIPYAALPARPQGGEALWIRLGALEVHPAGRSPRPTLPAMARRALRLQAAGQPEQDCPQSG